MKSKFSIVFISTLIFLNSFILVVNAQGFVVDWSNPEVIFLIPEGQKSNELWVLGDQADNLYVWWPIFTLETEEELLDSSKGRTLHTQMTGGEWRSPMDVMVWPNAGRLTSVINDQKGILHAFSPTDCVSYVSARHDEAISARGWGERSCLDKTGLANTSVDLAQDGTIYVMYAALGNHSLRLIHSKDDGETWSFYTTVEEDPDSFLLDPMMTIDNLGRLHAVWYVGQAPDAYPPVGVYYSRSDNNGATWTVPVQLGGADEGQPAIAVYNDDVHVLWNGDAAKKGRYYRYSSDAGESWERVEVLSPPGSQGGKGGLQRSPAIIVDNLGNVHALLHEQESLFYTSKIDNNWTPKQPLYIPSMMRAREVFAVRLAITGGNQLHAIYLLASYNQLNTEDSSNLIWTLFHQSREIEADSVSPIPWPTTDKVVTSLVQSEESPTVDNTIVPIGIEDINSKNDDLTSLDQYNPSSPLYTGLVAAIFFLCIVFLYYSISRLRYNR